MAVFRDSSSGLPAGLSAGCPEGSPAGSSAGPRAGRAGRRIAAVLIGAAALGLLLVACAKPTIRSVRHAHLDIERYRTWNWFPRSELPVAALGEDRIALHQTAIAKIEGELRRRGLRQTKDAPDLLVTYQLIVQRERHHKRVQEARKSMWSGRINALNIHVDPQKLVVDEYDHADLVIALADGASGETVWAGRWQQRVLGPFEEHMQLAVAGILGRMGTGTLIDDPAPGAPRDERLLAMVEDGFADRSPNVPREDLAWDSGVSGRGPRYETSGSPQFAPR